MLLSKLFKKKDNTPHCAVVIVAAGSSLRMGGDKLMMELCHVPVLARTLLAFQQSPLVDEIIVVTRMEKIMDVADICKKYGVTKAKKVIRGGTSRMESALAGVSELSCGTKLIAIHDGARPLVTQDVISRAVYAARDYLAAVPAIPSVDTLKNVEDERVIATLDRECIMRVQTPQVFDADLIKGALTVAAAKALRATRRTAGARLSDRIVEELRQLDMPRVQFVCQFEKAQPSETGMDVVRFLMSANAGEALKPMSRVASGGELARIMLAIKNVMAERDAVPTLIFDEVDAGVSGRAAQRVAEKLASVAKSKQVLCVTHLPQIAAMADCHLRVSKSERAGRTYTAVEPLTRRERELELARLIGGAEITETTISSAAEMLRR